MNTCHFYVAMTIEKVSKHNDQWKQPLRQNWGTSSPIVWGGATGCASESIKNLRRSESASMNLRQSYKYLSRFGRRQPSMVICSVKLTSNCTQNCIQCSIPSQSVGHFIDLVAFETNIRRLKDYGTSLISLSGGERAIHPELEEIFRLLDRYGFHGSNLLRQTPEEILSSSVWKEKKAEFRTCQGCWNTCYTIGSSIFHYLHIPTLKQLIRHI